jgi:uncharacterized small protein (DUF1192 family)
VLLVQSLGIFRTAYADFLAPADLECNSIDRTWRGEHMMSNGSSLSLDEFEQRIAIARDNIRQLIEQASASSGAEDEDRNADRIAQQTEELERLIKQRDALLKK